MIQKDPKKRITAEEALKHSFFKEDWSIISKLLTVNEYNSSLNSPHKIKTYKDLEAKLEEKDSIEEEEVEGEMYVNYKEE